LLDPLPIAVQQPGPKITGRAQQPITAVGLVAGEAQTDTTGAMYQSRLDSPGLHSELMFDVPDCRAACETLRGGAEFLTPPVDHGWEVRCFFRDPDGHLLELSEARPAATGE
jgi:catechol 2,3-dioxygenase-like lactoylglutathione lyase family enzyme